MEKKKKKKRRTRVRVQGIGRGKEGVDKLSDSSRGARNTSFDLPALFFIILLADWGRTEGIILIKEVQR